MTDSELNIAICEARGWESRPVRYYAGPVMIQQSEDRLEWSRPPFTERCSTASLPNHLTGIEALGHLHEAIMAQPQAIRLTINQILIDQLKPEEAYILDRTINATALERATALAKVLGIWVDTIPQPTEQKATTDNVEPERHTRLSFVKIDLV